MREYEKIGFNVVMMLIFIVSLYVVLFQGFGFPNISDNIDMLLRIILAFSIQSIIITNLKLTFIRLIPTIIACAVALWGGFLFITSDAWANVSFGMYFADYCTFFVGSIFSWVCVKFNI